MVLRFFILAVAFLLSCTSIERDSVCDEKSIKYNGCVGGFSSSSSVTVSSLSSSSSSGSIVYGVPVTYQGETYKTVEIGTQTWMASNLKYAAPGSKCGGGGVEGVLLEDENTTVCNIYGRLYNWATAMALPASCNCNGGDTDCSIDCSGKITRKHKGICPAGWHIPSNEDWNVLMKFINSRCSDDRDCDGAGTKLKATIGWTSPSTDDFGFSALPGGFGNDGLLISVAQEGNWWSYRWRTEFAPITNPQSRQITKSESVSVRGYDSSWLLSVRCVKD